jgi:predicted PurR-regulated permease PerM
MNEMAEAPPVAVGQDRLAAAVQRSKEAWQRLGMHLRSVTPAGWVRILLVASALAAVGWVMAQAFVPLVPFVIGLVLAYISAPLVEALDRVLPRGLAVLLVLIGEFLLILLTVAILVLPLAHELGQMVKSLPGPEQLRAFFNNLVAYLRTLPESSQAFIRDGLRQAAVQIRDNLAAYIQTVTSAGIGAIFGLVRTFGFLIGLLVLPTWLYSIVADQKRGRQALDRVLPDGVRPDFWALVRIVDRSLSTYLRGLALQGLAVGGVTYLGLALLEHWGLSAFQYKLLAAVLAGLMELVPDIGPFLWAVPAAIIGFSSSAEMGLSLLGAYLAGRWLVHRVLSSRVERRVVGDIHPGLLVVAIVALSQFGFLWLFLAAPTVAIVRDLFRYVYGRVSEPPRPAGVLPGEPLPAPQTAKAVPARQASRRRNRRRGTPEREIPVPAAQQQEF